MQDASSVSTKKLYYDDAYAKEFEARVLSFDGRDLVLDRTLFFPEEGGQNPDRGTIEGVRVTDVQIRSGEIHHILEDGTGDFRPGQSVHGIIDWPRRFSNMQQHSGEHLFSGVVHAKYGFENVGFHLSDREVTVDFDGVIPPEDLPEIELEVNRAVWADIPSEIRMTTPSERENLTYRSKLDLPGEVRIVTFPGVDSCACCAPHVARTGEIGVVKILSMMNWKDGVRLNILCGERALAALSEEHRILRETSRFLTTSAVEVFPQVQKMKNQIHSLEMKLKEKNAALLASEIAAVPQDAEDVLLFEDDIDADSARSAVNRLTELHNGYCAVLFAPKDDRYQYIIGSRTKDCRMLQTLLKEHFSARGGGKSVMIQGTLTGAPEELKRSLFTVG